MYDFVGLWLLRIRHVIYILPIPYLLESMYLLYAQLCI